jgi:hypothetical protein
MERWSDIPSLPGYQASSAGRIRSIDRIVTDSRGRSYSRPSVVLRLNTAPNGYLRFRTTGGTHSVHRSVLEAFRGPAPRGFHGAHGDGNKTNCALANLRWASPQDNAADKALHGTAYRPTGESHPGAKLTEADVVAIKGLLASGLKQRHVAAQTGVHFKTINSIARGKSWAHVQQSDLRAMGRVG